jgi:acetoin utilization protein AcuB
MKVPELARRLGLKILKKRREVKNMLVKNHMTPNPTTITPKEDAKIAFHLLKKYSFRQFPVVKDGTLIGIVTDRDLRPALTELDLRVDDVMTPNPVTILEDATVEEAARIISDRKFNALPVVSRTGELKGIITVTDILNSFLNPLRFGAEVNTSEGGDVY